MIVRDVDGKVFKAYLFGVDIDWCTEQYYVYCLDKWENMHVLNEFETEAYAKELLDIYAKDYYEEENKK